MKCERCSQDIIDGELYHRAIKRGQDDNDANFTTIIGSTIVHDFPCPTRYEITDGRVLVNGVDIGPESMYSPSHPAHRANAARAFLDAAIADWQATSRDTPDC